MTEIFYPIILLEFQMIDGIQIHLSSENLKIELNHASNQIMKKIVRVKILYDEEIVSKIKAFEITCASMKLVNKIDQEIMFECNGVITAVEELSGYVVIEISTPNFLLEQKVTNLYSPECRAIFGDKKCGIDLEKLKVSVTVNSCADNGELLCIFSAVYSDNYFKGHNLIINRNGQKIASYPIVSSEGNVLKIVPVNNAKERITNGEEFYLIPSCNKSMNACKNLFNNAENFRGEVSIG